MRVGFVLGARFRSMIGAWPSAFDGHRCRRRRRPHPLDRRDRRRGSRAWSSREWRPDCRGRKPRSDTQEPGFRRRRHPDAVCSRSRFPCSPCCSSWSQHRTRWADRRASDRGSACLPSRRVGSGLAVPRPCAGVALARRLSASGGGGSSFFVVRLRLDRLSRASISVASRAIRADDAPAERALDQRRVHLSGRSPCETPRRRGKGQLPTALAASVVPQPRSADAATCRHRGARSVRSW